MTNLMSGEETLLEHMTNVGYTKEYVDFVRREVEWLCENGGRFDSYDEALDERAPKGGSEAKRMHHAAWMGICQRFDVEGELPEYGKRKSKRYGVPGGSYYTSLSPGLAEVADLVRADEERRGLSPRSVFVDANVVSSFLLAMQERGRASLSEVTEEDVLAWSRARNRPGSDGRKLRHLLTLDLGAVSADAARIAGLVPTPPEERANVDYLRPDEVEAIRAALRDEGSGVSLRDRAIVTVLFYTGLRASDVAGLRLDDIDWEADEIRVTQEKTGVPLVLPLSARVGNAIYDYLEDGRPVSDDRHVFLSEVRHHDPIGSHAVGRAVGRVMDAAGVRVGDGRRRGAHLFRHNVATTIVGSGMQPILATAALGHEDPGTVNRYLHADIERLRTCALDVSAFGLAEGAFDV